MALAACQWCTASGTGLASVTLWTCVALAQVVSQALASEGHPAMFSIIVGGHLRQVFNPLWYPSVPSTGHTNIASFQDQQTAVLSFMATLGAWVSPWCLVGLPARILITILPLPVCQGVQLQVMPVLSTAPP